MPKQVIVCEYRSEWPAGYRLESERLALGLKRPDWRTHHIGSTSVPGLAAKPVIDILLLVTSLPELDAHSGQIESLGYRAKGEYGIDARRYFDFWPGGDDHSQSFRIHLHAFVADNRHASRHLWFRDYLRQHPDRAQTYGALKTRLAEQFPWDIAAYMKGKEALIEQLLLEAEDFASKHNPGTV